MMDQTITLRTNSAVKTEAQQLLKKHGYNLSEALNICLEKLAEGDLSILKKEEDYTAFYPEGFFDLFGSDTDDQIVPIERLPETKILEEV